MRRLASRSYLLFATAPGLVAFGATAQTADVIFASRKMRRLGALHSLVAFGFNAAILATMINPAASSF